MNIVKSIELLNVGDFEESARQSLPQMAYDYYASGANDEITLKENVEAYKRIRFAPRMLVDVSNIDLKVDVFGQELAMPIMIAPTAFQRLAHPDGELASTRAAHSAGTLMTLSTLATSTIEEVAAASSGPLWFQLYVYKDRKVTQSLVERAEAAGFQAIVLTVDSPLLGRRERDVRNRFCLPPHLSVANLTSAGLKDLPADVADSGLAAYIASLYDTSLTWKDVQWLRSITKLPVLVKGVLRADDAQKSIESGATGVIVSNHGGRQLDTVPATITVLPEIAAAVKGHAEVFVDGGIRRGTDVLKALSLGARAVLIGRPILWGLAVDGEQGVRTVLDILRSELELAMKLCGCPSVKEASSDYIYEPYWRF